MNGHCSTCDVERECAYPYKPTDCCDKRKFQHHDVKKVIPAYATLVDRLRLDSTDPYCLLSEAANRIKELEAIVDQRNAMISDLWLHIGGFLDAHKIPREAFAERTERV